MTDKVALIVGFCVGAALAGAATGYLWGVPGLCLYFGLLLLMPLCLEKLRPQVHVYLDGKERAKL